MSKKELYDFLYKGNEAEADITIPIELFQKAYPSIANFFEQDIDMSYYVDNLFFHYNYDNYDRTDDFGDELVISITLDDEEETTHLFVHLPTLVDKIKQTNIKGEFVFDGENRHFIDSSPHGWNKATPLYKLYSIFTRSTARFYEFNMSGNMRLYVETLIFKEFPFLNCFGEIGTDFTIDPIHFLFGTIDFDIGEDYCIEFSFIDNKVFLNGNNDDEIFHKKEVYDILNS